MYLFSLTLLDSIHAMCHDVHALIKQLLVIYTDHDRLEHMHIHTNASYMLVML